MAQPEIAARIREYVLENFLYMRPGYELADTDSLLGHGIIDSMGVMELVTLIQGEFGVKVQEADITEENFGTLEAIARFAQGRYPSN